MTAATAFPLQWPHGFSRTATKIRSRFKTTLAGALKNVEYELRLLGSDSGKPISGLVISTNYALHDQSPSDGGVAVYFRWDGIDVCFAIDRYPRIEDNLQAVAAVIDAHRAILRHGGFNIFRASFRGYAALPPPKGPDGQIAPPWWQVLGLPQGTHFTIEEAEARYRELVKTKHPDRGGDPATFNQITDAIRSAREEFLVLKR